MIREGMHRTGACNRRLRTLLDEMA
jgi:hypothetical protein